MKNVIKKYGKPGDLEAVSKLPDEGEQYEKF